MLHISNIGDIDVHLDGESLNISVDNHVVISIPKNHGITNLRDAINKVIDIIGDEAV